MGAPLPFPNGVPLHGPELRLADDRLLCPRFCLYSLCLSLLIGLDSFVVYALFGLLTASGLRLHIDFLAGVLLLGGGVVITGVLVYVCRVLWPGSSTLTLSPQGLAYRWAGREHLFRWSDIDSIDTYSADFERRVAVTLSSRFRVHGWLGCRFLPVVVHLRDSYRQSAEFLADLLYDFRELYTPDMRCLVVRLPLAGRWGTADEWHAYDDFERRLAKHFRGVGPGLCTGSERLGGCNYIFVEEIRQEQFAAAEAFLVAELRERGLLDRAVVYCHTGAAVPDEFWPVLGRRVCPAE